MVLFAYFLGNFLYDSTTEPHSAATRQTTRDWNKQATALLPHSLHPPCGPVQRPPEQEEGLVVCTLRWALDCSANGASPWQGTHSACSGLVLEAKLELRKGSGLITNLRKRGWGCKFLKLYPLFFFFLSAVLFWAGFEYLALLLMVAKCFRCIICRCNWPHVLLAYILQFGKP